MFVLDEVDMSCGFYVRHSYRAFVRQVEAAHPELDS